MNRLTAFMFFAMILVVIFFTVTGNHGLLHLSKINNELTFLEEKNRRIESEISDLKNEMYGLEHSSPMLEKHLRENLRLSRPGEIVYIFPDSLSEDSGAQ